MPVFERDGPAMLPANEHENRPNDRPHLAPVDGLRGIAISLVIGYHIVAGTLSPQNLTLSVAGFAVSLSPLVTNGWTGVNLFFVLSGFVLFVPYARSLRSMATLGERLDFYRRRAWRLLPLFYLVVVVSWTVSLRGLPRDPGELLSVLSLTYGFNASTFGPSFLPPLWSIGVEIVFSIVFPMLVLLHGRIGMARLLALAAGLALSARCAGILRAPLIQGPSFNSDMILCRLDDFVLGMAIAKAWADGHLPARSGSCAIVGLGCVAAAWVGYDLVLRGLWPPLARAVLNDLLDVGLAAILAAALAPAGILTSALSWAPLRCVGRMSYSLYLWHLPLLWLLIPVRAAPWGAAFAFKAVAYLAVVSAVGALSYRALEFPPKGMWPRLWRLDLWRPVTSR